MNIDIKIVNKKRICIKNSFCIHNLTDICNKCNVKYGNTNNKNLFESGTSKENNKVIERIYK